MKELFEGWQDLIDEAEKNIEILSIATKDFQEGQKNTEEYKAICSGIQGTKEWLNELHNRINNYLKASVYERKVPIKFRGKIKDSDKYICGWYAEGFNDDDKMVPRIIYDYTTPADWCEVEPDSVVQLVGYDEKGNEIYEGDEVEVYRRSVLFALDKDSKIDGIYKVRKYIEVGDATIGKLARNLDYQFLKKE